ncbi:transposase [Moraxella catarrhalis]|uniref:transposase n=1 Tax=Moraxella catarrhalis TaxID=480 RepID=UPI0007E31283|nr:transposase [Moraxella catarrhalis]
MFVYTLKIQVIYHTVHKKIISIHTHKGCVHDVSIARQHLAELYVYPFVLADKGYIGLEHQGLLTQSKKRKNQTQDKLIKKINKEIGKRRIVIEYINRKLKLFKILSTPYRNRHKSFHLRANLIAGIVNAMQR